MIDRLIINLPSGKSETRIIKEVMGRNITVETRYSESPRPDAIWVVDSDEVASMLFMINRVLMWLMLWV